MTIIVTDLTQAIDQIIETFNHHDLVDINVQPDFENMIDKIYLFIREKRKRQKPHKR